MRKKLFRSYKIYEASAVYAQSSLPLLKTVKTANFAIFTGKKMLYTIECIFFDIGRFSVLLLVNREPHFEDDY